MDWKERYFVCVMCHRPTRNTRGKKGRLRCTACAEVYNLVVCSNFAQAFDVGSLSRSALSNESTEVLTGYV